MSDVGRLRLYDTSDRAVRPVSPGKTATMYVCGITPYDATHLGHAATYVAFDVINRVLRDQGHQVHYVQNVTDVDDPLFERADRDNEDWVVLGLRETALFREDMEALRVIPPRDFIGAVESIPEAVAMAEKLVASGAAYVVEDSEFPDVYFSIKATEAFGYESGYDRLHDGTLLRRAWRRPRPSRASATLSIHSSGAPSARANQRGRHRSGRDVPAGTSNVPRSRSTGSAPASTFRAVEPTSSSRITNSAPHMPRRCTRASASHVITCTRE